MRYYRMYKECFAIYRIETKYVFIGMFERFSETMTISGQPTMIQDGMADYNFRDNIY